MRILAVETSTLAGGAALLDGDRLVGEYVLNIRATHSERLMAAVDHLLHLSGWELGQLEGLAVAIGPGSFTGLRIGVSAVKGLAPGLGGAGGSRPRRGRARAPAGAVGPRVIGGLADPQGLEIIRRRGGLNLAGPGDCPRA